MAPKKSSEGKGKHWTSVEVDLMLDSVSELLPRGANDWELVTDLYNERKGRYLERDVDCIRNKYKSLKNSRKPTGDPTCPDNVRKAKRIARDIENAVGAGIFDENDVDDEEEEVDASTTSDSSETSATARLDLMIAAAPVLPHTASPAPLPTLPASPPPTIAPLPVLASPLPTASSTRPSVVAQPRPASGPAAAAAAAAVAKRFGTTTNRLGFDEAGLLQIQESRKRSRVDDVLTKGQNSFMELFMAMTQQQQERDAKREEQRLDYERKAEERHHREEARREEFNNRLLMLLMRNKD